MEIEFAHPDDVVSGEGTRSHGGRFVRPGVRAVYASADEQTCFAESAARINRLAGRGGARLVGHPRITYVVAVDASTLISLTMAHPAAALLLPACLDANDVTASQEVGEFFRGQGIQAIEYPSAIAGFSGRNVAVFRDVSPPPIIELVNREQIIRQLRRLVRRIER